MGENDFGPTLEKGLSKEESTFIAILLVDEQIEADPIPIEIQEFLNKYVGIMSPGLLKTLPPRWGIDHEIELVSGAKTLANNAY